MAPSAMGYVDRHCAKYHHLGRYGRKKKKNMTLAAIGKEENNVPHLAPSPTLVCLSSSSVERQRYSFYVLNEDERNETEGR